MVKGLLEYILWRSDKKNVCSGQLGQILENNMLKFEKFSSYDTWIFLKTERFLGHVF